MFGLDAEEVTPTIATTFTTQRLVGIPVLREAMAQTARRVRQEVAGGARYGGTLEWTTGEGTNSGGKRRPHLHLLWKGLGGEAADSVSSIATGVWKRLTGAYNHTCEEIRTPGAAIRYVAAHHLKESQGPPLGWSGRRLWTSHGWWELGAAETRKLARSITADERLVYRCQRELADEIPDGLDGCTFDDLLRERVEAARRSRGRVECVRVRVRQVVDEETGELRERLVPGSAREL